MPVETERNMQYEKLPEALLPWYEENARDLPWRRDREPYHVWVSEIMLQQTRVEAVRGYYLRFLSELPDIAALAAVEETRLLKLWEGLGYYSRARNLQKAARQIMAEHGGVFPRDYAAIAALPGVGPYTAGAIASICFGEPRAAVDGNVLRVLSRITEDFAPIDLPQTRRDMARRLEAVYPAGACGTFTQALMELGAMVCTPPVAPVRRLSLRPLLPGPGTGHGGVPARAAAQAGETGRAAHGLSAALWGKAGHLPADGAWAALRTVAAAQRDPRPGRGGGPEAGGGDGRGALGAVPGAAPGACVHPHPLGDDGL